MASFPSHCIWKTWVLTQFLGFASHDHLLHRRQEISLNGEETPVPKVNDIEFVPEHPPCWLDTLACIFAKL